MHIYNNQINNYINIYSKRNAKLSVFQDVNKINLVGRKVYLHVTFFSLCPLLPRLKFSIAPMVNDVLIERTHLIRMHSSRMHTARSLIVSPYVVISHACSPFTMHAPLSHACPSSPHTHPCHTCSPFTMHANPLCHACPLLCHTCPPATMHAPWQPCLAPSNLAPPNHAHPLATTHAPQQPLTSPTTMHAPPHARPFAGGNKNGNNGQGLKLRVSRRSLSLSLSHRENDPSCSWWGHYNL